MKYLNKILLDTTYLLPIIGIGVEGIDETIKLLKKLREKGVKYYYTHFNILEMLGKLSRIKYDEKILLTGLISIIEEFNQLNPTVESYIKALKLRKKGFKDLIDLLLYTTSLANNIPFLTRDKDLIEFLQKHGEETSNIIYEDEFIKERQHLICEDKTNISIT